MALRNQRIRIVILASLIGGLALLMAACGGGSEATPTVEADPFVNPLPLDRAEMQIAAPDGTMPCGLAEVGWGYRVFNVGDEFPNCVDALPNLTVFCLTGDAQWSAENISDVDVSMLTQTVTFEVRQDGLCALFPAAAGAATAAPAAATATPGG